jgi:hypothetical protein
MAERAIRSINPVIYSELSLVFDSVNSVDDATESMGLIYQELPHPALFLAGRVFVRYRREGGAKTNVLTDFFIGPTPLCRAAASSPAMGDAIGATSRPSRW